MYIRTYVHLHNNMVHYECIMFLFNMYRTYVRTDIFLASLDLFVLLKNVRTYVNSKAECLKINNTSSSKFFY